MWILPVPRIYNLVLLEDIYIEHTSPCLNKIWDDLRYHVFPATQSCMTPENRSYLIETIYSRHRAVQTTRPGLDTISMVSMVEGGLGKAEAQSSFSSRDSDTSTQVPASKASETTPREHALNI